MAMSEIPDDLIAEVLSRLPVKTLLRFRCASKQMCALIDSPNFINLQLNQSHRTNTNLSLIYGYHEEWERCSLRFESLDDIPKEYNGPEVKLEYPSLKFKTNCLGIVGSCNGLICLQFGIKQCLILLNPYTKKHQILTPEPPPPPSWNFFPKFYGFGYDPVNDDYNIVRIGKFSDDHGPEVIVYSLRSNTWRRINHSLPHLLRSCNRVVVFNGALHWVATRQPESPVDSFIAAFDIVVDKYWEVRLPNICISDYKAVTFGASDGCLWLACTDDDALVELWVMKDYMAQEYSWTKHSLAFCSHLYRTLFCGSAMTILAYSKSTTELLVQICNKLLWIDLKQQTLRDICTRSSGEHICIASLVKPSLFKELVIEGTIFCS